MSIPVLDVAVNHCHVPKWYTTRSHSSAPYGIGWCVHANASLISGILTHNQQDPIVKHSQVVNQTESESEIFYSTITHVQFIMKDINLLNTEIKDDVC